MCSSRRWWFGILVEKKTANSLQTMMSMQLMMMLKHNKTWNYQIKWWKHTRNTTSDINGYEHIFVHIFNFFLFFFHFFIFFFQIPFWSGALRKPAGRFPIQITNSNMQNNSDRRFEQRKPIRLNRKIKEPRHRSIKFNTHRSS